MTEPFRIKRGVTLYSFQDEYVWGKLTLEGCLAELNKMGVEGVELIGDQMIHNNPHPEEGFYDQWHCWLKQYNLSPACSDIFINTTLYKNRSLTHKECVAALKTEIIHAHKLGFRVVRLVSQTPNDIIMPCLETAEKYDVQMALEIHAGSSTINAPMSQEFIEIMTKANSPYIGLVFDMGMFCRKFPRVIIEYYRREGVNPALLEYTASVQADGSDLNQVDMDTVLRKYKKNPIDEEFFHYGCSFENNPLDIMGPYLANERNMHGKFFEMTDEGVEFSIPYDEIIAYLNANHYNGFLCSEYEGNRFVPAGTPVQGVEQVAKHQAMLKCYIDG